MPNLGFIFAQNADHSFCNFAIFRDSALFMHAARDIIYAALRG